MFSISNLFHARPKQSKPRKQTTPILFFSECEEILLKSDNASKTKENSRTALRSLKSYLCRDDIPVTAITSKMLSNYQQWLWGKGVSKNTSAEYMRSLRALYNKVVGKRKNNHPFDDVTTTIQRTRKRAISLKTMRSVASFHTDSSQLQLSLDMFLFSFYCMGMPFVDIAHLTKENIDDDTLTYCRHKTGVEVVMHLEPEAREIIRRYHKAGNRYLFPLLKDDSEKDYRRALARHNQHLRKIEKMITLPAHISSYVSRHTWATHAFKESGDIALVASAIGHNSTAITRTYIKPLADGKTAIVNKKLLGKIKTAPIRNRCNFCKS